MMTPPPQPPKEDSEVARRRADDQLLAELNAPTQLDEAREALEFWREREKSLPLHRRAERKEASEMVTRWRQRLREAERAAHGPSPLEQILDFVGISWRPADPRQLVKRAAIAGVVLIVLLIALVVAVLVLAPPDLLNQLFGGGGGD